MEQNFIITGINRVVMVDKNEYPESKTVFGSVLHANELIFHFSGRATVYFGEQILQTAPNTVRFLPEGTVSRYAVDRAEHGECILIDFQTDRPISERAFVADMSRKEHVGTLFKRIFAAWIGKEDGYYFACISLLYSIFSQMQRTNYVPSEHRERIRPAINAIRESFPKCDLSSAQMAALCGVSESYFKRLFKERFGVPPKQYVLRLKINHACELLRMDRYTVTQIADMCAFSNVYFFSRQFKEHMGITPTQFIKKYRSSK